MYTLFKGNPWTKDDRNSTRCKALAVSDLGDVLLPQVNERIG